MDQIFNGVIIAVVSGVILSWFGVGKSKSVVSIHGTKRQTKVWKVLIIIGWIMFVGGGYYGLAWGLVDGFNDPRTGIGLSLCILGFFVLIIGKFGAWWNRD